MEKGDKVFGDKIFKLYGNNSLFILEKGGGKTSIIQLVLQVVPPNQALGKRIMKNNVQNGNSVHIAVEWIPDDENYSAFITGFSFHNYGGKIDGESKKSGFSHFNYIIDSESPALEDIGFVQNGHVTPAYELWKLLKKYKGVFVPDTIEGALDRQTKWELEILKKLFFEDYAANRLFFFRIFFNPW